MKRMLSFLLAAVLLLAAVGCQTVPATAPETEPTSAVTEAPTAPDTEAPTVPNTEETPTEPDTAPDTEPPVETSETTSGGTTKTTAKPVSKQPISADSPKNGASLSLGNEIISRFLDGYEPGTASAYLEEKPAELAPMKECRLSWTSNVAADYYNVVVGTDKKFTDAVRFVTTETSVTLKAPKTDVTYYWQVTASVDGKNVVSDLFTFSVGWTPRCFAVEGVSNVRDLGGWLVGDGSKKVKEGMVYRSGTLDGIKAAGREVMLGELGIVSDLDLRAANEGTAGKGSPLGEDTNYILAYTTGGAHYDDMYADKAKVLAKEIKVFADPANYPIDIHCSVGRDRTGTLVFALLTLLGVDSEDIYTEYELSFFSTVGWSDNCASFFAGIKRITGSVKAYSGATPAEKMENFLISNGVTAEEIATIRKLLIEEAH